MPEYSGMDNKAISAFFQDYIKANPDVSAAAAALESLMTFLEKDKSETVSELKEKLDEATEVLTKEDSSVTSIKSACALFLRFITLTALENPNFSECKKSILTRGHMFLEKVKSARKKIARIGHPFILDGSTVLTHSRSRVVFQTLLEAHQAKKRFKVFITESCPDKNGYELEKWLTDEGINCTLILDASVGYILEKVDFVLLGAEGVVENGGIINKIGTYTIAMCAAKLNKPVYVLAESFKFVRFYPLCQQDVPDSYKMHRSCTLYSETDEYLDDYRHVTKRKTSSDKVADFNFKSKDIGMRAQRKLLGRMANKHIAKVFIDDTSSSLLDNLYRLVKNQSGNKKEAEKVIKNIIKIVIKIGILYRNDQFNSEELGVVEQYKRKFHSTAMAVASFYEVDFSFDRNFLMQAIHECSLLLQRLVQRHLTEKSLNRIQYVFGVFGSSTFLEDVFKRDGTHKELLGNIVSDMHKLMEEGSL